MGGKPQRPKVQGYVDEHLFVAFESYRQQHELNQSQALQKLLTEFFGFKQSSPPAPPADTLAFFQKLSGQLLALDDRLKAVEARLAIDSGTDPAPVLAELATELTDKSASGLADRLAVTANGLAAPLDRLACESANRLAANGLAAESADGLAMVESANGLAAESASGLAEKAIAVEPEDSPDSRSDVEAARPWQQGEAVCDDQEFETIRNNESEQAFEGAITATPHEESEDLEDAEPAVAATTEPSAPVPAIAAPSPQPPEVKPPAKAPDRKLFPHTQAELAERWGLFSKTGAIDASSISRRKTRADFPDWSKGKDPQQVSWEFQEKKRLFYPLP